MEIKYTDIEDLLYSCNILNLMYEGEGIQCIELNDILDEFVPLLINKINQENDGKDITIEY